MIDNGNKEIDIKILLQRTLYSVFRNIKQLKIFVFVWIGIALFFLLFQNNKFQLSYFISSDHMSGQKIELIYSDLQKLVKQNDYQRVSQLLKLPIDDAKKITSFKVSMEEPELLTSSNTSQSPDFYFNETNTQITLTLSDTTNVNKLVDALNDFLVSSNYFQKIKNNEIQNVLKLNQNLATQKMELDSINLLNMSKFITSSGNPVFFSDISEIKRNIYAIEERIINNNRGLERLEEPVNLVNYPILKKDKLVIRVLLALLKGMMISVFSSILFYLFVKIKKEYAHYKLNIPKG
jgi:hypothetical protein